MSVVPGPDARTREATITAMAARPRKQPAHWKKAQGDVASRIGTQRPCSIRPARVSRNVSSSLPHPCAQKVPA